jgi:succinoglycan biosynthesis transport protein ExoP
MSLPHVTESSLLAQTTGTPARLRPPPIQMGGVYGGPPKPPAQAGSGISAGFLFRSFQHWWRVAVPAGIVCAVLAGAVVWATWTPKYRAYAILRIPDKGGLLTPTSPDTSPRFAQTQLQSITSAVVLVPALADEEVAQVPEIKRQISPLDYLEKNIKATSAGGSELYRIEYIGETAEDAAKVVQGIIRVYLKQLSDIEDTARSKMLTNLEKVRKFRETEIENKKKEIIDLEKKVIGILPAKGDSPTAGNVLSPLFALQQKLIQIEADREILNAQVAAFGQPAPTKAPKIPDDVLNVEVKMHPDVREQSRIINSMRLQLEDIEKKSRQGKQSSSYKEYADRIVQAEKELTTLQDEVRNQLELRNSVVTQSDRGQEAVQWKQKLTSLDAEYTLLKKRYDEYMKTLSDSGGKSVQLQFLYAELERESGVFNLIAQRKLQVETETHDPEKVIVAADAQVPLAPIEAWPFKQLVMFCGAAFVLPFFVVVGWEKISRRIADAEQLSSESTLTIVGEICQLPTRPVLAGEAASRRKIRRDLGLFQESVDGLRTCLLLSETTSTHRVFAVTSAVSGEGKTSLVSQLGISLARATGKRVLIVDADMRSPNLHEIFETRLEPGLASVLRGQTEIADAIVEEVAEGVHLLPAGRVSTNPHNYVGNGAIPKLIEKLREIYDYIVIDTPPILCASEALVLAKAADGTLLCALRDVSRSRQVRIASERLTMAGVNLMGAVLSGTSARRYASTYGNYAYLDDSLA